MDNPNDSSGGGRLSKKELQGPRPAPLKVRKDSHKIKKPPVAPQAPAAQHQQQLPPQQPPRQPVIIYTVSPKVIHANPSEFMTLVQQLTGSETSSSIISSSTTSSSSSSSFQYPSSFTSSSHVVGGSSSNYMAHHVSGALSPAARFASIEKTKLPFEGKKLFGTGGVVEEEFLNISGGGGGGNGGGGGGGRDSGGVGGVERTVVFPGILSPGPGSLPPISPNLFSPYFHDPIPSATVQHGINRNCIEGNNFVPSPFSTSFISPTTMFSPSSLDFLHHIMDS